MHAGMQHTCLPAFRCIASAHNVHLVLQKRVHSFKHSYFPCGQVCTVLLRSLNGALFWQSFNSSNVGRCRTVSGCACCPWHAKTRTWHEVAGQTLWQSCAAVPSAVSGSSAATETLLVGADSSPASLAPAVSLAQRMHTAFGAWCTGTGHHWGLPDQDPGPYTWAVSLVCTGARHAELVCAHKQESCRTSTQQQNWVNAHRGKETSGV